MARTRGGSHHERASGGVWTGLSSRAAALGVVAAVAATEMVATADTAVASASEPGAGAPGTVFVANFGGEGASGIQATGSVTSYRPSATGNASALGTFATKINAPQGVAFDASGDLWVANSNTNTLVEYSRAELGKASPAPVVVISSNSSGSLAGPGGLTFDPAGDMWVANTSVSTVVEYTRSQLARSGAPTPKITITNNSFNAPFGVALDSHGNLWVSDNAQQGSPAIYEYLKSDLTSASPTPRLTISVPLSPIGDDTRSGLSFDSSGDLWFVDSAGNSLDKFSKEELTKTAPKPTVTISAGSSNILNAPDDLVLDQAGDVWVANTGSNTIVEYSKSEVAKSGSPAPVRTLSGKSTGLNYPMSLAVEPAPKAD
ncbi:MAG TPA: NHL repeat-containing protein [Acidimicrobiales bacterium]|nr:NHL repeat-containing protein [Acidimicrobiales bacterium]